MPSTSTIGRPTSTHVVAVARQAAEGRGTELDVTIEGPFDAAWLDRASPHHRRLASLGVSRVIVRWDTGLGLGALDAAALLAG